MDKKKKENKKYCHKSNFKLSNKKTALKAIKEDLNLKKFTRTKTCAFLNMKKRCTKCLHIL